MFKDYNPINNYDMVETREVKEQIDRSVVTEGQNDVTDSTSTSTTETEGMLEDQKAYLLRVERERIETQDEPVREEE